MTSIGTLPHCHSEPFGPEWASGQAPRRGSEESSPAQGDRPSERLLLFLAEL